MPAMCLEGAARGNSERVGTNDAEGGGPSSVCGAGSTSSAAGGERGNETGSHLRGQLEATLLHAAVQPAPADAIASLLATHLPPGLSVDPEFRAKFLAEVQTLQGEVSKLNDLKHSHEAIHDAIADAYEAAEVHANDADDDNSGDHSDDD